MYAIECMFCCNPVYNPQRRSIARAVFEVGEADEKREFKRGN